MTALVVAVVLLWILVLILGAMVLALARQVGVLHERLPNFGALASNDRLRAGEKAPLVVAPTLRSESLTLGAPSATGRGTLLFFLSPTCPVCKALLPALRSLAWRERGWCDLVLASDGEGHESFVAQHALDSYPYVVSTELGLRYGVGKLPFAVLIDETGVVTAFGLVNSREQLESLFRARELGAATLQDYIAPPPGPEVVELETRAEPQRRNVT